MKEQHHQVGDVDLETFEGWLRYQKVDPATQTQEQMAEWQCAYEEACQADATPIGSIRPRAEPGDCLYAVAVRKDSELRLTLWVRRSRKGETFVIMPLPRDPDWAPHASYHRDGRLHMKSRGN
jgi:hypothetical protein